MRTKYIKYMHITKRTTPSKGYVVQYEGSTVGGVHATVKEACKTLLAAMGLRRRSQLPLRSERGGWKYKRQANTPGTLLSRTRRLLEYAHARKSRDPSMEAPAADLLASLDHVTLSGKMYKVEQALHVVSLHFKYGPCKSTLLKAFRSTPRRRSRCLEARAKFLQRVLIKCARLMAESPIPTAWPKNCNRFRDREQGPIMTLRSLKIIRKPTRLEKKTKQLLFFVEGHDDDLDLGWLLDGSEYPSLSTLTKFVEGVDRLVKAVGQAPRTCSEWRSKMRKVSKALGRRSTPRLAGNYLRRWSTRGFMIDLMRQSRVRRLQVDTALTLSGFLRMNPDQHGVLNRIYMRCLKRGDDVDSVNAFVRHFSVKPIRVELLSMYCCFADDVGFQDNDFHNFNLEAWLAAATELRAETGVEPHPVFVAKRVRCGTSESETSSSEWSDSESESSSSE